jgi:hypothetical protein
MVTSWMKISAALANMMGASALIIFTSSSSFMIFLIRAKGNSGFLKSDEVKFCTSWVIRGQKLLSKLMASCEAFMLPYSMLDNDIANSNFSRLFFLLSVKYMKKKEQNKW